MSMWAMRGGCLTVKMPQEWYDEAYAIRRERDDRFKRDIFDGTFDERATGDLGEIAVYHWLKRDAPGEFRWFRTNPEGRPDFIVYGLGVEVKTQNANFPWRLKYHVLVNHTQIEGPGRSFFFCYHELPARTMWLLGGVSRKAYRKQSKFELARTTTEDGFYVKDTCYRASGKIITLPLLWLRYVEAVA